MIARFALLIAMTIGCAAAAPACAQPSDPLYTYCRISGATNMLRTVGARDGRFVYQAAWGGIVPGATRRIDGYLGWHYGPGGKVELQLAQVNGLYYDDLVLPDGSRAALDGPSGITRLVAAADRKQDNIVFRFDVDQVLAAFPGAKRARLRIYAKGSDVPRASVTVDLVALRRVLADATAADATLAKTSCDQREAGAPEVTDPAPFTQCVVNIEDGRVEYTPWSSLYTLDVPIGDRLAFVVSGDASAQFKGAPLGGHALLAALTAPLMEPFVGGSPPMLSLITTEGRPLVQNDLHYVLSQGDKRITRRAPSTQADWPALLALERGGPVRLELYDAKDQLLRRIDLPPGTFAGIRAGLARLADRVAVAARTPMLTCQPEGDIIIT